MLTSTLQLTGGLTYHARAWRYRGSLWAPFRTHLKLWLQSVPVHSSTLLMFGSSAGYTLDATLLAPYRRIVAVEVDPLARWLLRRRYPFLKIEFIDKDVFHFERRQNFLMNDFQDVLRAEADADIWFTNILGQISFITKDEQLTVRYLQQLQQLLNQRNWLRFHDCVSTTIAASETPLQVLRQQWISADPATPLQLVHNFWGDRRAITAFDHNTSCLSNAANAGAAITYLHWQLTPHQSHLIGCVSHRA